MQNPAQTQQGGQQDAYVGQRADLARATEDDELGLSHDLGKPGRDTQLGDSPEHSLPGEAAALVQPREGIIRKQTADPRPRAEEGPESSQSGDHLPDQVQVPRRKGKEETLKPRLGH